MITFLGDMAQSTPSAAIVWSAAEQFSLNTTIKDWVKHTEADTLYLYTRAAAKLTKKSVRDVASRIRWLLLNWRTRTGCGLDNQPNLRVQLARLLDCDKNLNLGPVKETKRDLNDLLTKNDSILTLLVSNSQNGCFEENEHLLAQVFTNVTTVSDHMKRVATNTLFVQLPRLPVNVDAILAATVLGVRL